MSIAYCSQILQPSSLLYVLRKAHHSIDKFNNPDNLETVHMSNTIHTDYEIWES